MRLKHTRMWGTLAILALISGLSPAVTYGVGATATPLIEAGQTGRHDRGARYFAKPGRLYL